MQIMFTVVEPASGRPATDVVLTVTQGTRMAAVRPLLRRSAELTGPPDADLYVDGRRLADEQVVGAPPLVAGAVVTAGHPRAPAGRAEGGVGGFLELHVVGGPDSGTVHALPPGTHRIGRAGAGVLTVEDPDCSRVHAEIRVSPAGISLEDLGSTNGTWLDGQRLTNEAVPFPEGASALLGSSRIAVRMPDLVTAATQSHGDGYLDVNRSPHIAPAVERQEVRMPAAPQPPRAIRVPVVAMVVPLLVAVPLAFFWSPLALLFGVMTPVMLLGNLLSDKVSGRRDYRQQLEEHAAARAVLEDRLAAALDDETRRRRAAAPDAAEVLRIADVPLQLLWQRHRSSEEALLLRFGTSKLPSTVTVVDPAAGGEPTRPDLDDVPVTVPLRNVGVLGVAGDRGRAVALVRSLLGQIAVLHTPRDVALVVLARPSTFENGDWAAVRWIPHTAPAALGTVALGRCERLVGTTPEQVRRRVAELVTVLDARQAADSAVRQKHDAAADNVVVLLDGAQHLRSVPGVARLLQEGPEVGIQLLCLDSEPARLPAECRGTVLVCGEVGTRLEVAVEGSPVLDGVVADLVSARWFERVARALAPLRDATPDDAAATVPNRASLLDVVRKDLGLEATDHAAVARRWTKAPRSTAALLGVAAAGPYVVDLSTDGPHVLVGGTTGSGKSELLQTLITSLALANRPDEMGFVLVDYKGGSAFADCARLPHTLGIVTDLDEALTRRALESLSAEIVRRERLLGAVGAKDIEDYQAVVDAAESVGGRSAPPQLGRLVLVIDEFRVLAEELPGFIDGLVRLAAVGRSLGVHLVLATQRPAGVVSSDIKANMNLRICLRVRDAVDSLDIVDVRNAAAINERTPGRAFSRSGSSPLVEFQTARVGGHVDTSDAVATSVRRSSWHTAGDAPARTAPLPPPDGPTDLARLVDALCAAARLLELSSTPSPWLPPLPKTVTLNSLCHRTVGAPGNFTAIPFGLLDEPAQQEQRPAVFDVASGSCLAVAGTARSGRTTVLRTLALSAARGSMPADLAIYALDGGAGLAALTELPHVGAVVPRDDTERASRLVQRLTQEVIRRQRLLAQGGFADVAEQRRSAPTDAIPYLLLLVDGWEALQQTLEHVDAGRVLDGLLQVVRQGPGVGLVTVVTGDRGVMTGQLGGSLGQRLVLRLADPTDAVLAGVPARDVPADLPPGRGLLVTSSGPRLVQVALSADQPDGAAQVRAIGTVAAAARARLAGSAVRLPFRVPPMPDRVPLDELEDRNSGEGWIPLGVGGPDVAPVGLDLPSDGRRLLIAGHPRSGRSTALRAVGRGLSRARFPVAVVCPTTSSSATWAAGADAPSLGVFDPLDADKLAHVLRQCVDDGSPAAVLVDDAEQIEGSHVESVLLQVNERVNTTGEVLVVAGSTPQLLGRFSGLTVQVRKGGSGVLLGPAGPMDGDLFGVRTPRRVEHRPGRGMLVRRGELVAVQIGLPPEAGEREENA